MLKWLSQVNKHYSSNRHNKIHNTKEIKLRMQPTIIVLKRSQRSNLRKSNKKWKNKRNNRKLKKYKKMPKTIKMIKHKKINKIL